MNIPTIARKVGTDLLVSSRNGGMALRIINSIVPSDMRLDPDVATGADMDRLLGSLSDDLYIIAVKIDVPTDGQYTHFPKKTFMSILVIMFLISSAMVLEYVLKANHHNALKESKIIRKAEEIGIDKPNELTGGLLEQIVPISE